MYCRAILALTTTLLLAGAFPAAADPGPPPAPAQRVSLFDGQTLQGWQVLKCEAEVRDGAILMKGGNGMVQSAKKYQDFVLEWEWKPLKADEWDSGVYFRYETISTNSAWPRRYQANLRKNEEGNVAGIPHAVSKGRTQPGEWNQFKLTVKGTAAEMEINGKPAWKADGLEEEDAGFIGLQCEVPGGGQCLFRNVYLTELK